MKIKRLYLKDVSITLGHKRNIDSAVHKIVISENSQYFTIDDKVLIPMFNVVEVLLEDSKVEDKPKKIKVVN